LLIKF
jgi:hypothetical protein